MFGFAVVTCGQSGNHDDGDDLSDPPPSPRPGPSSSSSRSQGNVTLSAEQWATSQAILQCLEANQVANETATQRVEARLNELEARGRS